MSESTPAGQPYGFADVSYRAAGEADGVRQLVERFYAEMESNTDPAIVTIRQMHKGDLSESIDKLVCFLIGWMGGPKEYGERYGPIQIPRVHMHLSVGDAERDAWLQCMQTAVDEQDYAADFKVYLMQQLRFPAQRIRETSKEPDA